VHSSPLFGKKIRLDAPVASMVDLSVVANLRATLAARRGIIVL
jgi:hypothetical protein